MPKDIDITPYMVRLPCQNDEIPFPRPLIWAAVAAGATELTFKSGCPCGKGHRIPIDMEDIKSIPIDIQTIMRAANIPGFRGTGEGGWPTGRG